MADAVSQATDIAKGFFPSFAGGKGAIMSWGLWVIGFILTVVIIIVGVWLFIRTRKFNKTIFIYEKIDGKFRKTGKDKAMEVAFSTAGDTVFYLKRRKKYIPNPSLQSGSREYWYFIRRDGEWINFELGDLDEQARKAGAHFLDKEVRFARTQIVKGLKERYDKPGFWKQYGLLVFSIAFIVVIGVMTFLLFDKWVDLARTTVAAVDTAGEVMDKVSKVMGSLDNICAGSGMRPAG